MRPIVRVMVILLTFVYLILVCRPFIQFVDYTVWLFVDTFTLAWRILSLFYIGVFIIVIWILIMRFLGLWDN